MFPSPTLVPTSPESPPGWLGLPEVIAWESFSSAPAAWTRAFSAPALHCW